MSDDQFCPCEGQPHQPHCVEDQGHWHCPGEPGSVEAELAASIRMHEQARQLADSALTERDKARAQLAAAEAKIAQAPPPASGLAVGSGIALRGVLVELDSILAELDAILSASPVSALDAVRADAWDEAAKHADHEELCLYAPINYIIQYIVGRIAHECTCWKSRNPYRATQTGATE